MSKRFTTYSPASLPEGFVYPPLYLQLAESGIYPEIYPWWFIDANTKAGALAFTVRRHDGRELVPFAKVDDGRGDVACFDGSDCSGAPSVQMLVLDASRRHYSFPTFEAWLEAAQADARCSGVTPNTSFERTREK